MLAPKVVAKKTALVPKAVATKTSLAPKAVATKTALAPKAVETVVAFAATKVAVVEQKIQIPKAGQELVLAAKVVVAMFGSKALPLRIAELVVAATETVQRIVPGELKAVWPVPVVARAADPVTTVNAERAEIAGLVAAAAVAEFAAHLLKKLSTPDIPVKFMRIDIKMS